MGDLAHVMGGDLQVTVTGDLALVSSDAETQQRVLHRLLTSPGTYIWQIAYGAGLPSLVGSVTSLQQVGAIIRSQIGFEAAVSLTPEPTVTLTSDRASEVKATITYVDAVSGNSQILALPIGG